MSKVKNGRRVSNQALILIPFLLIVILSLLLVLVTDFVPKEDYYLENRNFLVRVTSDGFEPDRLTSKVFDKITFLNNSGKTIWIASDDHPSHEIYPEFDSKGYINPGEKWDFSFDRVGDFGFHDHLNPTVKGRVIVLPGENKKSSTNELSEFSKKKFAVTEEIKELVEKKGPIEAWSFYKQNYKNSDFYGTHDIAHYLGSEIYKFSELNGIDYCNSSFAFGCYHGFIEKLIEVKGVGNVKDLINKCEKIPLFDGQVTCYHGIGHAILPYFKYELVTSLGFCDRILKADLAGYCWRGAFMENISSVSKERYLRQDSHWPCVDLDDKYKAACYHYQNDLFAIKYGFDVSRISNECKRSILREYVESCIRGLSHTIAQKNLNFSDKILQACSLIKDRELYYDCIIFVSEEFVFQGESYDVAKDEFCSILVSDWHNRCIKAIDKQRSIVQS